jgi:hypothetical protein
MIRSWVLMEYVHYQCTKLTYHINSTDLFTVAGALNREAISTEAPFHGLRVMHYSRGTRRFTDML